MSTRQKECHVTSKYWNIGRCNVFQANLFVDNIFYITYSMSVLSPICYESETVSLHMQE